MDAISSFPESVVKVENEIEEPADGISTFQDPLPSKFSSVYVIQEEPVKERSTPHDLWQSGFVDPVEEEPSDELSASEELWQFNSCTYPAEKRTKLRFTITDDVNLLKETLACNPYADKNRWKVVFLNFRKVATKKFSFRAVKEHVDYLINMYVKEVENNVRKPGTDEEHGEREQLLHELNSVRKEFKNRKVLRSKDDAQKGLEIRSMAVASFENQRRKEGNEVIHELNVDVECEIPELQISEIEDSSVSPSATSQPHRPDCETNGQSSADAFIIHASPHVSQVPSPSGSSCQRQGLQKFIAELLREKKEKDWELESRKLDIEQQKIDLENRKLALEEAKFQQISQVQEQQNSIIQELLQRLLDKRN